jgi:CheY-specific phosphatase CheX
MKASISEVLEQMFFLPIDIIDSEAKKALAHWNNQEAITVSVAFEGSPAGTFRLTVPHDLAASITADFLGALPESLSTEQVIETVKEMTNMLAGNALSAYDPQYAFNLRIPEVIPAANRNDRIAPDESDEPMEVFIETMDSCMVLRLSIA